MTETNIRAVQESDVELLNIWELLAEIEYDSSGSREVVSKGRTYIDRRGQALRLKEVIEINNTVTTIKQVVQPIYLPMVWRAGVIRQFHNELGHPGSSRMVKTVSRYYTWAGMRTSISDYCRQCIHCQKRNSSNSIVQNPKTSIYPQMHKPFDRVHIDLFGELPETDRGYKYVLVFKCALTKWVEYFALKDKSAETIAECFTDEILMRHAAPKVLISDGGKEFNNRILKAICKMLKVRKITTAPYNPRADGLAENQVKTCKDMLSSYCNAYQNDWDKYLSVVAHYYRTTFNEAINMTPYRALYGRDCTQINTMWVADVLEDNVDLAEYVVNLSLTMIAVWESLGITVYENSIKRQKQHVRLHGNQRMHRYKIGDQVLVKKIPESLFVSEVKVDQKKQKYKIRAALQNRYKGPYTVVKVISENTIVCMIKGREQHMAYKNIKPYYPVHIEALRKLIVKSYLD